MQIGSCVFKLVVLISLNLLMQQAAHAEEPKYKSFFGHTVSFKLGTCRPDEKDCTATIEKTIKFDKDGTLTESFMCGDRTERRHVFGQSNRIALKGNSKDRKSLKIVGSGNALHIDAALTLVYADGDTHEKIDRFQLSTSDGATCSLSGSREMVDKPENRRKIIPIIGAECRILQGG
jgi:hypothetical protein